MILWGKTFSYFILTYTAKISRWSLYFHMVMALKEEHKETWSFDDSAVDYFESKDYIQVFPYIVPCKIEDIFS